MGSMRSSALGKYSARSTCSSATTWISAALDGPGIIKQVSDFRRVVLGELDGRITARLQAISDAFRRTGITLELSNAILKIVWTKFVFLSAASSFGSLTRLPLGSYRSLPETREMIIDLMKEVQALAVAQGIRLDPGCG